MQDCSISSVLTMDTLQSCSYRNVDENYIKSNSAEPKLPLHGGGVPFFNMSCNLTNQHARYKAGASTTSVFIDTVSCFCCFHLGFWCPHISSDESQKTEISFTQADRNHFTGKFPTIQFQECIFSTNDNFFQLPHCSSPFPP